MNYQYRWTSQFAWNDTERTPTTEELNLKGIQWQITDTLMTDEQKAILMACAMGTPIDARLNSWAPDRWLTISWTPEGLRKIFNDSTNPIVFRIKPR